MVPAVPDLVRCVGPLPTEASLVTPDAADTGGDPIGVLLVISNLEFGGAQRQVVELANGLNPRRFDVHVCSLSPYVPLAERLRDADRRLHVVRKRFKFDAGVVRRLAKLLRRLGTDIVHSYLFDADIAARLAGRRAGTPVIVGSERNAHYPLKRRQLLAYWLTRGCATAVIANSHEGAAFNRQKLGHRESQYHVIHNGVDTARFRPRDNADVRRDLGIGAADKVVGMFASFKRQKNQPMLLRAAAQLRRRHPGLRLLLVGDELYGGMHGSDLYKVGVQKLIDELGLRSCCVLPGNRPDVERLYCACEVTVLPSLFEGTPNAVLESLACGVPVVVTDVCDHRLIVPDGQVGFVVPLGDEDSLARRLDELLSNEELRSRLGRAGHDWVSEHFSTACMVSRTEQVYRRLLTEATGQGTS